MVAGVDLPLQFGRALGSGCVPIRTAIGDNRSPASGDVPSRQRLHCAAGTKPGFVQSKVYTSQRPLRIPVDISHTKWQSWNVSRRQSCQNKRLTCALRESAAETQDVLVPGSELLEFILQGILLPKTGISAQEVATNLLQWENLGLELCRQLNFDVEKLSQSQRSRIYHYYLPVFFWCVKQMEDSSATKPMVIGISAPQGCGKTTVVESLEHLFRATGKKAAAVSIDDFYLTASQQTSLAKAHEGNKLLELRGNAGSHDLDLGTSTLSALKSLNHPAGAVSLPRYDKSAFSGKGDRADAKSWPSVSGPLDVVLLEGWMLGFTPISAEEAAAISPQLLAVNEKLGDYSTWYDFVDRWIAIQVSDVSWVYDWRLQAEHQMKATGKPGMTDEQVADFVSRYMPAYNAYLPRLYSEGPPGSTEASRLSINIDRGRNPIG